MLNRKMLWVCGGDDIKHILMTKMHTHYENIGSHKFGDILGNSLLQANGDSWREQRKALQPAFHRDFLNKMHSKLEKHVWKLVARIDSTKGQPFEMIDYAKNFMVDSVADFAFGFDFKAQSSADLPIHQETPFDWFDTCLKAITTRLGHRRSMVSALAQALNPVRLFVKSQEDQDYDRAKAKIHALVLDMINQKKAARDAMPIEEREGKILDWMDFMLQLRDEGEHWLTERMLIDEVVLFLFAATDTTSTTMTFTLYNLAKYPQHVTKVREEMERVGVAPGSVLTAAQALKMEYLDAVIKESLRLYPPILILGKKCIQEDTLPSGYFVPKGTQILISAWSTHRDPRQWDAPEDFRPERFLIDDPMEEKNEPGTTRRNPYLWVPFSAGPRTCIGRHLGMQTLKTLLTAIIQKFDFKIVKEEEPMCRFLLLPRFSLVASDRQAGH